MGRIFQILRAPGVRHETRGVVATQVVYTTDSDQENGANVENINRYIAPTKTGLLDRCLDKIVEASGSEFVYFSIIIALLIWAFLGIPFGTSNIWQIVISNAQAIINMIFDAFLMRQQFNSHESLVVVAACLRSRTASNKRMLQQLTRSGDYPEVNIQQFHASEQANFASKLPSENWLGRISTGLSIFMGHIYTVIGFWVCIVIWIAFGKYCGWSNTWQLYINSATSALMVFVLAFLANIRERHTKYMTKCLESIWNVDAALELQLRLMTGDTVENVPVVIPAPQRSRIQRGIDYYADLVGTLAGIAILIFVMVVWVGIGPALHFNTNWWLLIGTYAGLIGLNDGFVLRNVFTVLGDHETEQFAQVEYDDMDMLAAIGVEKMEEERVVANSLTCRVSLKVGDVCSHQYTVVAGAVSIIGMIIGASAMGWSVTGQLLCNVPPSIIESFLTMILITGHNMDDAKRRVDFHNIYLRRLKLVAYVDALTKIEGVEEKGDMDAIEEAVQSGQFEEEEKTKLHADVVVEVFSEEK